MTVKREELQALKNIMSGFGPLVHGVRMSSLERRGLVRRVDGTWRITGHGVSELIDAGAI